MTCTSPNKAWKRRGDGVIVFDEPSRSDLAFHYYEALELPCQQCLDCRLRRASDWSLRIMHEASMHKCNCVVTLTYDEDHLPNRGMLNYRDVQLFIMRLRKAHPELRGALVYVCGCEYGKDGRPHYHIIFMGFDPSDKKEWSKSLGGTHLWLSDEVSELWRCGHVLVGELTKESADYVARYCVEKVTGERAKEYYRRVTDLDFGPPFVYWMPAECIRVSKGRAKPGEKTQFGRGIGARWLERFWSDVFPADHVVLRGGAELKPPRYYDKLLKRRDAEAFEVVRAKREAEALMPQRQADETPERRSVRAQCTRARAAFKKREL
jgi:hypothetical protein